MPSAAGMAERTRGLRKPFSTTTCNHTWTDDGTSFSKPHSDASEGVSVGLAVGLSCERAGSWVCGYCWLSKGVCGALCAFGQNVRLENLREQHTHTK